MAKRQDEVRLLLSEATTWEKRRRSGIQKRLKTQKIVYFWSQKRSVLIWSKLFLSLLWCTSQVWPRYLLQIKNFQKKQFQQNPTNEIDLLKKEMGTKLFCPNWINCRKNSVLFLKSFFKLTIIKFDGAETGVLVKLFYNWVIETQTS